MALQPIDIDTPQPNGKRGDPARVMAQKINTNDEYLEGVANAASQAAADAQTAASAALPKAGGTVTGSITQSGSGVMIGYRMSPTGTGVYGSMVVNNGTELLFLATTINNVNGGFSTLRPLTINMATGETTVGHLFTASDGVKSTGYFTRTGTGGVYGGNRYNFNWNGNAEFFIDGTKIGNIAFATSDRRLKRDIQYLDSAAAGDEDIETVLAARPCTWYYRDIGIWKDDGVQRRSFVSDDMQDIKEILAPGDRHAENEFGIIPLNLNTDAIISTLWGALRREIALRRELELRVAAIEQGSP